MYCNVHQIVYRIEKVQLTFKSFCTIRECPFKADKCKAVRPSGLVNVANSGFVLSIDSTALKHNPNCTYNKNIRICTVRTSRMYMYSSTVVRRVVYTIEGRKFSYTVCILK